MKITMYEKARDKEYQSLCGMVLRREHDSKTPNGNDMNGRWVLRSCAGDMLTFAQYRHDIAEQFNLELVP